MTTTMPTPATTRLQDGRVTLYAGDNRDAMRLLADNSIDSIVTDPPYALVSIVKRFGGKNAAPAQHGTDGAYARASRGFMNKQWDNGEVAFAVEFWAECLRVLKPGGHVVAFSGTRTQHRMVCAIEDAGFEIRDQLAWVYGCLDDQTMAVTRDGVTPYHKIKNGDLVLAYDHTHMSYQWERVEEVCVYDVEDTVYRITTDSGDQVVSRNHRCIVERGGKEVFEFAENAAREQEIRVPVLEDLRALLNAIPDENAGTGDAQSNVLSGVHERDYRREGIGGGEAGGPAQGEIICELRGVRGGILAQHEASGEGRSSGLQSQMQRCPEGGGVEGSRPYGEGELDGEVGGGACGKDDGRDESRVEGGGDVQEQAGQLCVGSVRSMSNRISADVTQGRVCDGAPPEGGNGHGAPSNADGMRASHRSQPAEQRANELDAVRNEPRPQAVRAWGGHKTVVGRIIPERYRGVIWCLRVKSGAFVAVRNGFAFPTGNSGFPKSHDVAKGIQRRRTEDEGPVRVVCRAIRAAMDAAGLKSKHLVEHFEGCHPRLIDHWAARDTDSQPTLPTMEQWAVLRRVLPLGADLDAEVERLNGRKGTRGEAWTGAEIIGHHDGQTPGLVGKRFSGADQTIRSPSEEAAQWRGWGTALKPAWEPICLARKPLSEPTVAANVLRWGTGALNIDGCRVDANGDKLGGGMVSKGRPKVAEGWDRPWMHDEAVTERKKKDAAAKVAAAEESGRWPANLAHDGSDEVVACFPETGAAKAGARGGSNPNPMDWGNERGDGDIVKGHNDNGGSAARFFYHSKASRADRDEGLDHMPASAWPTLGNGIGGQPNQQIANNRNIHPTVKPTDVMRWLVRMVTPPGGTTLDPFMGSGSTGKAAVLEGFGFIGMEREAEYIPIAEARITWAVANKDKPVKAKKKAPATNDNVPDLFSEAAA